MKAEKFNSNMSNKEPEEESYWQQQIATCEASGLKKSVYCRQQGINYDRMMYWKKKLSNTHVKHFVPVKLKSEVKETTCDSLCTIVLTNGCMLKIHEEKALLLLLDKWK